MSFFKFYLSILQSNGLSKPKGSLTEARAGLPTAQDHVLGDILVELRPMIVRAVAIQKLSR